MNKLLSQDEVDALLKGLDAGDIESEQKPDESKVEVESFDWASQGRNVRGSMPLLEVINSRFCQKFKGTLSSGLRKLFDITQEPMETIRFSEFQRSLPVPTSMHLFKMEPLRGMGMLVIESRLVFSLVEALFGGSGTGSAKIEGRDFTPIEKRVIEKVVQMALMNEVLAHGELGVETGMLKDDADQSAHGIHHGGDIVAADARDACGSAHGRAEDVKERGFAAAVRPQYAENLAGANVE